MTMIRPELIHPMLSHFPIALLSLAPVAIIVFLVTKKTIFEAIGKFCLYIGCIFYFLSLFTGDESMEIIKYNFCHLIEINQHEESAQNGLILLIAILAVDVAGYFKFKNILQYLKLILFCVFVFILADTSHKGAMLVYERGAAVNTDTMCKP